MTEKDILQALDRVGAVITGSHIVYASGRHGTTYINKDALYPSTLLTSQLCLALAQNFMKDRVETVVAPAVGGVILSQWVAYHLTQYALVMGDNPVLGVYAEKGDHDDFVIKRGYDKLVTGRRVLVVEDILTTGGSVKKVVEAVQSLSGTVLAVGALCNRGQVKPEDIGVTSLFALADVKLDSWDEKECPLCAANVPINTDVGKGREFLATRQNS